MAAQVAWAMRTPGADALFVDQSNTDTYFRQVAKARQRLQRAVAAAGHNDVKGQAGVWSGVDALREAMFGQIENARRQARAALDLEDSWETHALAAMALARLGDAAQARELADKLSVERPLGTLVQNYWLPAIRAEIEIQAGNATRAIELLRAAEPYDMADTRVPLLPAYVRGDAYLRARDGRAAAEFLKLLGTAAWWANARWGAGSCSLACGRYGEREKTIRVLLEPVGGCGLDHTAADASEGGIPGDHWTKMKRTLSEITSNANAIQPCWKGGALFGRQREAAPVV
jgi:hypothetical protein